MIEFKRAGDVMVFECVTFRIEVATGAERIEFKEAGKEIPDTESLIQSAFKVLDMMLEHKARKTHIIKDDVSSCEGVNSDIEALKRRVSDSNNLLCVAGD